MIKNERQLRITKSQLGKFGDHLSVIENEIKKGNISLLIAAEAEAIKSQIAELDDQVYEYESLWNSGTQIPILNTLKDIPKALINARLSSGLSQKELAERIGFKEQQIQRYEATNYESASLSRIRQFVDVLNLELSDNIQFPTGGISLTNIIKRLINAGIERSFIINRLLPSKILINLKNVKKETILKNFEIQVIEHIGNIFGWTFNDLIGQKSLSMNVSTIGKVHYKVPKRVSTPRLTTYIFYTHYLASLLITTTQHLTVKELPTDPIRIHQQIQDTDGSVTLEGAVRYIWGLGVPVISLNDPGAFHGAHFREKERNVIILKHRTKSHATWLFSLFHELWHATEDLKDSEETAMVFENIEELASTDENYVKNEEVANLFAGAVLLGKPTDPLIHMCFEEANYKIPNLKISVQNVARREKVPIDILANCVAFRVSQEGMNWWGTANNLQEERLDIQRITRDILLDYVDLSQISGLDLDLLRRSLRNYEGK